MEGLAFQSGELARWNGKNGGGGSFVHFNGMSVDSRNAGGSSWAGASRGILRRRQVVLTAYICLHQGSLQCLQCDWGYRRYWPFNGQQAFRRKGSIHTVSSQNHGPTKKWPSWERKSLGSPKGSLQLYERKKWMQWKVAKLLIVKWHGAKFTRVCSSSTPARVLEPQWLRKTSINPVVSPVFHIAVCPLMNICLAAPDGDIQAPMEEYYQMGVSDVEMTELLKQHYDTEKYGLRYFTSQHNCNFLTSLSPV